MYHPTTDEYEAFDKYHGRKVTEANFGDALGSFLNPGSSQLIYHIPMILEKLYKLADIIYGLKGYRFYASSLLFIYDGDEGVQNKLCNSLRKISKSSSLRKHMSHLELVDFAYQSH